MDNDILQKVLLAALGGLFGLVPVIVQVVSARAQARSQNTQVSRLATELEFLDKLATLSRANAPATTADPAPRLADVQPDLARILMEYRTIKQRPAVEQERTGKLSLAARMFLLFRPTSARGWALHTSFYFLEIFWVGMLVSEWLEPTPGGTFSDLALGSLLLLGIPWFFLRRAAVRLRDQQA